MNHNHCAEFVNLLQSSIKFYSNFTYYNKKQFKVSMCSDYGDFISNLEKQKIKIKTCNVLPKSEIGISFNPDTKTLLVFPTTNFKVSDK